MAGDQFWFCLLLGLALLGPLAFAVLTSRRISRDAFIFDEGRTGIVASVAGVVCGNIGAGTFVAIMLFAQVSPIIGLSLAVAYTLGLILCAIMAPFVQNKAKQFGATGFIDLIILANQIKNPVFVWLPVALVFLLRAAVQLLTLAALLSSALALTTGQALAIAVILTGSYTAIGGYRAAVRTDVFQAVLIILGMGALLFANISTDIAPRTPFWDLGPYRWPLLIGVWLFIPVSAVLAIDNWQRMVVAKNIAVARLAFIVGAAISGCAYLIIYWLGINSAGALDIATTLRSLMPPQAPWIADILLIAVIISSIDTFVMPLLSGLQRTRLSLFQLRVTVLVLFAIVGILAWLLGDILQNIIAAFSALVAFLPAVFATFFLRQITQSYICASLSIGVLATVFYCFVDVNLASFIGLLVSSIIVLFGWTATRAKALA